MKLLIFGGDGMLGHQLLKSLSPGHEVKVTLRQELGAYRGFGLFSKANAFDGVDVRSADRVRVVVEDFRPDVILNAIGIVKQRKTAKESIPSIEINSLLPHRLAALAGAAGARLVHFSTDCVFSGRQGPYTESDTPDAEDLYGRSKLLGEVAEPHCITLRTSIIGHELARKGSLIEWFLAQRGTVRGFRQALYTGFSTIEIARIVERLITKHADAHGIWHVSSEPIDKFALLDMVRKHYGLDTGIEPTDDFHCDRRLDSSRFRAAFDYQPPAWNAMIKEMSEQWKAAK